MLYLIGLGLSKESIGIEAREKCREADNVYLESYTVDFPYKKEELEKTVGKEVEALGRDNVESNRLVEEAGKEDVVLLVYGSPLMATTHISLILEAKEKNVKCQIIHNASIFDAITNTGLQAYKFGKTGSLPDWEEKGESKSFVDVIESNMRIKAHTLLLVDIGLELKEALEELEEASEGKIKRLIVCSRLGCDEEKTYFDSVDNLKKFEVKKPYCFIIPSKLHFKEKEALEKISE